jgi:hypothetical protein
VGVTTTRRAGLLLAFALVGCGASHAGGGDAAPAGPGDASAADTRDAAAAGDGGGAGDAGAGDARGRDAGDACAPACAGLTCGRDDGCGGPCVAGSGCTAALATGTIVPLYSYPPNADWTTLTQAQAAHPAVAVIAVINPDSGPGAAADPAFASGITALVAGGCQVLGYVATTYGAKPAADAEAEIDAYVGWYPATGGIFFDEMSGTAGDEGYYAALTAYAKGQGLTMTVGNPGMAVPASFIGTVDVILVYEDPGLPTLASLAPWQPHRTAVGIIPYGVAALDAGFVAAARQDVGYIYVTDDDGANPWDQLATYFDALVAALAP